ncbi:MAG: hypothetical protein IPP85_17520 [Propionivibrio sp.]|nr:hypothetical protein [Propionivibrio sp.]
MLDDSFNASDLGNITQSGSGTVSVTGILDLSSGTLDIGSAGIFGSGGLSSLSGTIKNGTLINTNSTPNFNALGGSTLDGVTLGSNLNFTGGSYTLIKNSLLLANGITVNLGNHSFYWNTLNPTQELKTVSGNAPSTRPEATPSMPATAAPARRSPSAAASLYRAMGR